MNDGMIVSRVIMGATCSPDMEKQLRSHLGAKADVGEIGFSVFQTTASRGTKTVRVLCCWAGGEMDKAGTPSLTLVGHAALDALMRLPACMDDRPVQTGRLLFCQLKMGPTPLRDKVIDLVLKAVPGDRLCFVGDLAGELDGHMFKTFNATAEPIFVNPL
jgi:hypothetical protein